MGRILFRKDHKKRVEGQVSSIIQPTVKLPLRKGLPNKIRVILRYKPSFLCFKCGEGGQIAWNCHTLKRLFSRSSGQMIKQANKWRFHIISSKGTKRREHSSSNEKRPSLQEVKKVKLEISPSLLGSEGSLEKSWSSKRYKRVKLRFYCYHCWGRNHMAENYLAQKRSLS